ncbi:MULTISPECIES: F0F1 ATP synthase subunit B [unclassified Afifella]|uniref:F0F1 ATP synthase subunit B n=1 Tax=unclassified Afifella TaxID=2624128 RepID=UPI001F017C44|nr:F0F1 ATP synthase subunit B [Afifella sp. JA880]MCF1504441.1 F0F1 ATP synthase subunit B [Afifella sp. H1R]MCT8266966.1 F0F1 ATP synthase subunit B [Afifella sp. JA880]
MVTTALAQTAAETAAEHTEIADSAHGAFPPFDPSTYLSQLIWLAVFFGLLYYLLSKMVLPRIATILEERHDRIADDLAEAEKLKRESDEAIAAYEQALAEARQRAHGIAQDARDKAKAEVEDERAKAEAELEEKLQAAEARIGEVRDKALAEVDAIAKETTEALVETLSGEAPADAEVGSAVSAAMNERR